VTEPGDEVDSWLRREVEPLAPPPGTFERIHRRARRRKLNQAAGAAAAVVVVIAAAVLVPTLGLLPGGSQHSAALRPGVTHTVTVTPSTSTKPTQAASSPPVSLPTTGTGLGGTTSQSNPAPAHFRPTSITMIGNSTGAVIGQAGIAGHCAGPIPADCTSLAGTSDYGGSWYGVSAPVTGVPAGATGTSQLRFLNATYAWAFGPQLYETSDGGATWGRPVPTGGARVTDLEAAGDRAFVVLASCQGDTAAYAADCSTFSLSSLVAGTRTLHRIALTGAPGAAALGTAGQAGSAVVVIRGVVGDTAAGTGYLLAPSGDIFSGSVGGGAWTYAGRAPCAAGGATATGSPLGAQLTVDGSSLLLNCAAAPGGGAQAKKVYTSATGAHWTLVSRPPPAGTARSLAATPDGQVVLATTAGLDYSADGSTWQAASVSDAPRGGFSYVGMTSDAQGVALPADAALGEVFITGDGGQSWSASPISG
jgi:hypothetical protein